MKRSILNPAGVRPRDYRDLQTLHPCGVPTPKLKRWNHTRGKLSSDPRTLYWAVLPPSTRYDAPVMNEALADARKTMVSAISSGLPTRLSGTVAARPAFLS